MIARFLRATIVLMGPQPSLALLILTYVSLLDLGHAFNLILPIFYAYKGIVSTNSGYLPDQTLLKYHLIYFINYL